MSSRDHIVRFSSKTDSTAEYRPLPVLLKKAQSIFIDELKGKLVNMLDTADDRLFDMSETSYNNAQFDAMRLLRVKREGLISRFDQELTSNFQNTLGKAEASYINQDNVETLSFENIALVKDDDLEEDIATDTMINRARITNQDALENIRTRIDTLISDKSIEQHSNPFEPVYICDAFRMATQTLDLDITSVLIIYKLFDRSVISDLETVYSKVNEYFIDKGILPQLRARAVVTKSTSHSHDKEQAASTDSVIDNMPINESDMAASGVSQSPQNTSGQNNVLAVIQQLLNGQRQPSQPDSQIPMMNNSAHSGADGQLTSVNTNQLIEALSKIQVQQTSPVDLSARPDAATLKHSLGQQLPQVNLDSSAGQLSGLGQFNEDMIDIVSMLFDFILEDENLQPELKSVIGRLQIPMLKVGLVDQTFFSERRHPARVLLNELAHAGLSWDKKDPSAVPMFDKICAIAETIIQDFNDDTTLFANLLEEFIGFKKQYQQRANIFEKRTKEAEEGKAKTESARSEVNKKLKSICQNIHAPEVVRLILKNVWSHVMLLEKLKDNKQGWDRRVKVAKLLVWSVQPIKSADRLEKLLTRIPILVKSLRDGMELISFSSIESTHFLESLESTHRAVIEQGRKTVNQMSEEEILRLPAIDMELSGLTAAASHVSSPESEQDKNLLAGEQSHLDPMIEIEDIGFSKVETGEIGHLQSHDAPTIDEHVSQTVEQLRAGSWVELMVDGQFKRSKLAARIASSGKYIFVNRNGMKMAEYLTAELCLILQNGDLKILDDEALFDRALESVISNLRTMKTQA